ncbi:MAG: SDR family oxidoreductase, partial [Actinomycetota bacterium]|nr:SDR family oxidoreductase [Actinomycetota bacterium]
MPLPAPRPDGTCLVTGASSGIGRELARALAARGLGVTLVARREERLRALADELAAAHGIRAEVAACDLTDATARAGLLAAVAARGLEVDVLVSNAGITNVGRIADLDPADEVELVRTNVEAVVDLTPRLVPGMVARGRGGVLTVASIAAFQPSPNQASYAASKAFLLSYSDALAGELVGTGVTVTALCPGPVPTEIFARAAGGTNPVDRMPDLFWRPAEEVAGAAVEGLDRGDLHVFVGAPNRLGALAAQHLPRLRGGLGLAARLFT